MLARLLLPLLLLCFSSEILAEPDWFINRDLKPKTHYIYIGYGLGDTLQEAKLAAREDIASQLSVSVDSTMELKEVLIGDNFTHSFKNSTQQQTRAQLRDLILLKSEKHEGSFFVVLEYQHLSFDQEFSNKIKVDNCENQVQHPYLLHSPLFKELNSKLPCHLNIELVRKNHLWMLSYKNALVQLPDNKFFELYSALQSDSLLVTSPSNRILEGKNFALTMKSEVNGYVSLFNVYADGMVSLLQENIPVKENIKRIFPNKNDEIVFEAGLLEKGRESIELYIGIYSKTLQNYTLFKEADNSIIHKNELQYQFGNLLQLMKQQNKVAMN